jgi:hypothetical protein
LSNDISEITSWKGGGESKDKSMLPKYHTIYNEFRGIVLLTSNNPFKLPLNTSKSGLNVEDRNYHYILNKMILAARPIIDYLTDKYRPEKQEEDDIEKKIEEKKDSSHVPQYIKVEEVISRKSSFKAPYRNSDAKVPNTTRISYLKEKVIVDLLIDKLNVTSAKEVGEKTFDYYCKMEDINAY